MTETDVANLAIALFDDAPIADIAGTSKTARLAQRHFAQTRRAELEANIWHFAMISEELATATDIGDGWYEYDPPEGMLRLVPLTYDNLAAGVPITWEQRNGKLYSDQAAPRGIRYIEDKIDPNTWPPSFVDVVAGALGVKMAHALTHKAGMVQLAQNAYDRALNRARVINAVTTGGQLDTALWSYQRGDTRYWRP